MGSFLGAFCGSRYTRPLVLLPSGETKMDFGGVSFCNLVSTNYYIDFTDNVWLTF